MGVSENRGYLILGVLVIGTLLFRGTILGSPIFGNSHLSDPALALALALDFGGMATPIAFKENKGGGCQRVPLRAR